MDSMTTSRVWRTASGNGVVVSTVLVHDGGSRYYETSIVFGMSGVSDGRRTARKFDAGIEHDAAVAFARGHKDPSSKRDEFWTLQLEQLKSSHVESERRLLS
jgi:hypothetical protein